MTWSLGDMWRHPARSLCSLEGNRVEHSKIKFVSTRGRVISSIYKSIYTCNLKTAQHSIILKLDFGTSKTSAVVGSNYRRLYCRLYHS